MVLPELLADEVPVGQATAAAMGSGLHAVTGTHDTVDPDRNERPDVGGHAAVSAQDRDHLPARHKRGRHLVNPFIPSAKPGIDLLEQPHLLAERQFRQWIVFPIEMAVRAWRGHGDIRRPSVDETDRIGGTDQRVFGKLRSVGIGGHILDNAPEAHALNDIVACLSEAPIVEDEGFGLAEFHEELAVVGADERVAHDAGNPVPVHAGSLEEKVVRRRRLVHGVLSIILRAPYHSRSGTVDGITSSGRNIQRS